MSERRSERVLVIDDDDLSREVLELLLSVEGYIVTTASGGEEALAQLPRDRSEQDVVLMDLQMPGLSGGDLAKRLRAAYGNDVVVLAMSGSRPDETTTMFADGFLMKPLSASEFRATLARTGVTEDRSFREPDGLASVEVEVLDSRVLTNLEGMMGKAKLRELYELCLVDASKRLLLMSEASEAGDDQGLRRSAHAAKGSLGMVGANELEALCGRIEKQGIVDNHVTTLREFPKAMRRLRRMLIARGVDVNAVDPGA